MRWVIGAALIVAAVAAYLIKSGVTVQTKEQSLVRPGKTVETHTEQAQSSFLRAKNTIRDIQIKKDEEAFSGY